MKNNYTLILFLIFSVYSSFAQDWTLPFSSRIEKNGKKLQGATVTLIQGGKQVQQTMTGDDGAFKFQIPPNGDYTIVVTKTGHCTKKFQVSTRGVPADKTKDAFKGFNIESISLFEPLPGIDYSVLNQPLVKVTYSSTLDNFDYDEAYSNQMLDALDRLRQLEKDAINKQKELEANYNAAIKTADNAFKKKDWTASKAAYNQAIQLKPAENYPKDQLAQIDVIIKDQEALTKKASDDAAAKAAAEKAAAEKAAAEKAAA
ncbi:MAG: carboxypeptidase-like regulatory domain-containing protein, partial [Bacteroidia bacterium]|nr:carboxypeptidase-like regulatory domain-containing protein [Bacteroidia bacterium]